MDASAIVLGLTLFTAHADPGYRAVTPGAYVVLDNSMVLGVVRNSIGKTSLYAGGKIDGPWGTDLVVGAISGYPGAAVRPLVTLGKAWGPVRAQFIPPTSANPAAVTLSWEFVIR